MQIKILTATKQLFNFCLFCCELIMCNWSLGLHTYIALSSTKLGNADLLIKTLNSIEPRANSWGAPGFISFHFYIFLEGYPSALLVFKGPSFKKKDNIYIQLKYNDCNTTTKNGKNITKVSMLFFSLSALPYLPRFFLERERA